MGRRMAGEACRCAETFYIGKDDRREHRVRHPWHDCTYVRARNALIPEAERRAARSGEHGGAAFSREMDALWAERRLAEEDR